jgi:aryl-alcohol dehydrogenase-like predicted oxidoreductase
MRALNDVVESGMVRYIGASSVSTLFIVSYVICTQRGKRRANLVKHLLTRITTANLSKHLQYQKLTHPERWRRGNFKPSKT